MILFMNKIRLNEFFCDNLWRWKCGLSEKDYNKRDKLTPGSVTSIKEDLPDEFEEILQAANVRMDMGRFRYGPIKRQSLENYDVAKECIKRIQRYIDGNRENLEHLVDAFNMCRIEFYKGKKAGKKIISIDDGEHAEEINKK